MVRSMSDTSKWFWGGRTSLDLVSTIRFRDDQPIELLERPADLVDWLIAAGLTTEQVSVSTAELDQAKLLREAIYRLATATRTGRRWRRSDTNTVNDFAATPPPVPSLTARQKHWSRPGGVRSLFSLVARDAIDLLASGAAQRIQQCAAENCTRLFVDMSRSGSRRWCSMEKCGNRAKVSAFRDRRA